MNGHTILLVEDNPITRKMLRFALETEGYPTIEAGDGAGALAAAAGRAPELVVLDYVLPDMDGLSLLSRLREELARPELSAIVVTGMVSRLEELRASASPGTQFAAKPIEPSRLLELVAGLISTSPAAAARGRRVLVVDDEAANRKLLAFRLKHAGYDVDVAPTAAEALELARRRPPDAIVSDILMPGMDGFGLSRSVRQEVRLAATPMVLVSSAYVDDADRELARRVGANVLVVRTPDLGDVLRALEAALAGALPAAAAAADPQVEQLHQHRLQVQLERQTARNEALLRQTAIQATALSIIRGLSEVLAQPTDVADILGDVLVHCLDAAGLSTGLLYVHQGGHRVQAQFGLSAVAREEAEGCFGHPELIERVLHSRQPLALSAASAAGDPGASDFLRRLGLSSALLVPFVVLGEGYGELVLASDAHDLGEPAWTGFARSLSLQFGQTVALGQSLKRVAASEGRYRALMEHANDAILIIEPQGRILEVNRETERILGRPREEIVGQPYPTFMVPEESEEVRDLTERFPREREFRIKSRHLLRPQGPPVAVEVSTALVPVGEEQVGVIILHDITERQRGQAALLAAQARLQHVVTSSPAVLFALSVQGNQLDLAWVSDNVERLLGYTVAEAMQPDWWLLALHPDDRERVFQHASTVLDMGYVALEYRFRNKAGAYLWLRTEMRLVGQSADVLEVIGSWSDVTARKEAELATQEAAEQYRLLFESNPQPMCVIDEQSLALLAVNDAAIRHYGYSREEFLAMTAADLRPPEDVGAFLTAIRSQGSRFYKSTEGTWRHRRKDGTIIEVEVAASRIAFEGREAWLTVYTDVTDKKTLEAQLTQAQRIESLGRLAGGVAHDFNNLLGIISGYGELLRQRVSGDVRLSKYARDILAAAERAAGLTRQLLAFSRKQVLQPRPLDLNAVVADVEKMLRRLIGEDVQLVTVFAQDLAPVRADPGQIEQVLMNLAVNARDAMPRGGRLTIETANYEIDEAYARLHPELSAGLYVMLAVSDTGEGMPPEVRARIFEPFFTTKEVGKGTGLGLATVHGIVRQSGGHVWVYSEVGQGTTFKVLLPRADHEAPAEQPEAARPPLPTGTETVLVVEDEAGLRGLMRECLEGAGYTVLEAPDGLAALEVSGRHPGAIDLLLTDTVMPGMTGRELAEALLAQRPGTAVLFTSGYTDDTAVLRGVLAEEMDFLQKPFTLEALARTVREVLDKSRGSAG